MLTTRLIRSDSQRKIAGVCGGIAEYLDIDVVFVRLAFVLLVPASFIGPVMYLALMAIMPGSADIDDTDYYEEDFDKVSNIEMLKEENKVKRNSTNGIALMMIGLGLYLLTIYNGWWVGHLFFPAALIIGATMLVRNNR